MTSGGSSAFWGAAHDGRSGWALEQLGGQWMCMVREMAV